MTRRPSEDGLLELELDDDASISDWGYDSFRADFPRNLNTPRMWVLSLLFAAFGSSINLFFSLRYPSVSISPIIALLLAHPLGLLWDHVFKSNPPSKRRFRRRTPENGEVDEDSPLISPSSPSGSFPRETLSPPTVFRGKKLREWLGQGRWNEQEHCCVYIASNVSFGFAFATDVG